GSAAIRSSRPSQGRPQEGRRRPTAASAATHVAEPGDGQLCRGVAAGHHFCCPGHRSREESAVLLLLLLLLLLSPVSTAQQRCRLTAGQESTLCWWLQFRRRLRWRQ